MPDDPSGSSAGLEARRSLGRGIADRELVPLQLVNAERLSLATVFILPKIHRLGCLRGVNRKGPLSIENAIPYILDGD